jgi:hypothetical protein
MQSEYIYDGEHCLCMLKECLPEDKRMQNQETTTLG